MQRFQYPSAVLLALLAASAPYLLSRERSPRWPALVVSVAFGLSIFTPKEVAQTIRKARADQVWPIAYDAIADKVKRLVESDSPEVVIVSSRRTDYFARLLGQANSWKLLTVRELMNQAKSIPSKTRSGVLVYCDGDEIREPPTYAVVQCVASAWPARAALRTVALLPGGHGGVWSIRSVP